ncbi:hypothetical protein F4803DRAFT_121839 [Xylaria telfairii]|nr:hypothetical protein F4803DRAFT_121839 [Xylaria telfairii]
MAHQTPTVITTQVATRCRVVLTPRPLFIYGTLCAMPLLSWVLTGNTKNTAMVARFAQPARINGYARLKIQGRDHAAVVKHPRSSVDGYLLWLTKPQRTRVDSFEGDSYKAVPVVAAMESRSNPGLPAGSIEADMYVWGGDINTVTTDPWSVKVFEEERLNDWLDTFEGMEFIGQTETETLDEWTII